MKQKIHKGLQTLGRRVYQHRRQNKLTQKQLAEAAQISVGQLNRLEKGKFNLRFFSLALVAERLNLQLADLMKLKSN